MTRHHAAERMAVAASLALFLCRVMAASAIVPPWQGPDEPTHFALSSQRTHPAFGFDLAIWETERQVLASMARHRWWRFYQEPTPTPVPSAFSEVPEHLNAGTADQPAYYLLASTVLRLTPGSDIESEYLALRTLSMVLSVFTLVFGWLGTRALFGGLIAAATLAVVALHPQFLLSAISVNPDVLINLCGAVIWWQVACLASSATYHRGRAVLLIAAASVVAALSKRNGIPLGVIAMIATVVAIGRPARSVVLIAGAAIALVAGVISLAVFFGGEAFDGLRRLLEYWSAVLTRRQTLQNMEPGQLLQFVWSAIDTSWLFAGWLRFAPPEPWSWVARALTLVGIASVIAVWRRLPADPRPLVIALLFVVIQLGALIGVAFIARSVPQGRYFFGVLFPAIALMWWGLLAYVKPPRQRWAILAVLAITAGLDMTGFLLVLQPAYRV